ncbi:hypothetical protein [Salisaeta longa]|uniref:hypothetical protein n=1 Tax=Salisaeta longa TaxID=503170 RepID=UPI0012FB3435|nr:hypothetical protein [Salisaeta longa]
MPVLSAGTVMAQERCEKSSECWSQLLSKQIDINLHSNISGVRQSAILLVIELAQRNDPGVNLAAAVPGLFATFEDPRQSDELRLLALTALEATDSKMAYSYILGWTQRGVVSSKRLDDQVQSVLRSYERRRIGT